MGIPFAKTITKSLVDNAIKWVNEQLKSLKEKTDLDGDGVKDFDEYPVLLDQIKNGLEKASAGIDLEKLLSIYNAVSAAIAEVKSAIKNEEVKAGLLEVKAAGTELLKLAGLAWAQLLTKQAKDTK